MLYTDRQKKPDTFSCCIKTLSLVRGELFFVCNHLLLLSNDSEIVFGDNHLIKNCELVNCTLSIICSCNVMVEWLHVKVYTC